MWIKNSASKGILCWKPQRKIEHASHFCRVRANVNVCKNNTRKKEEQWIETKRNVVSVPFSVSLHLPSSLPRSLSIWSALILTSRKNLLQIKQANKSRIQIEESNIFFAFERPIQTQKFAFILHIFLPCLDGIHTGGGWCERKYNGSKKKNRSEELM